MNRYAATSALRAFGTILLACWLGWSPAIAQRLNWICSTGDYTLDYNIVGISSDASKLVGYREFACRVERFFEYYYHPEALTCGGSYACGGCRAKGLAISLDGTVVLVGKTTSDPYPDFMSELARCVESTESETIYTGYVRSAELSANGEVALVCSWYPEDGIMRWTETTGLQPLGVYGTAKIAANGSVIMGIAEQDSLYHLFRWTETEGLTLLHTFTEPAQVTAVSADGAVATVVSAEHAFRWSLNGGLQPLNLRVANVGVSLDGTTVYGTLWAENTPRAFRWTEAGGFQTLFDGYARGVSADGSVLVGVSPNKRETYYWSAAGGLLNLNEMLCVGDTASYLDAVGVSQDGRYVIGRGYIRGWASDLFRIDMALPPDRRGTPRGDVNGDGVVDDADLLTVLFHFGNRGRYGVLARTYSRSLSVGSISSSTRSETWNAVLSPDSRAILITQMESFSYSSFTEGDSGSSWRSSYLTTPIATPQILRTEGSSGGMWCPPHRECESHSTDRTLQVFTGRSLAVFYAANTTTPATLNVITQAGMNPVAQCYTSSEERTVCPQATALSENGVVAGIWRDNEGNYAGAFRSEGLSSTVPLPTLGGNRTYPLAISTDGMIVIGKSEVSEDVFHAFRYTSAQGIQSLGTLGGGRSEATHIARNGARIFGKAENATGEMRLFYWSVQEGMRDIGVPSENAEIRFIADDGSVAVGHFQQDDRRYTFRWTASTGVQLLDADGYTVEVTDMSADGTVLVGRLDRADSSRAFRWTSHDGFMNLGPCVPETRVGISPDGLRMAWISPSLGLIYWWNGRIEMLSDIAASQIWGMAADGSIFVTVPGSEEVFCDHQGYMTECWQYGDALMVFTPLFGDLNNDGRVDDADLLIVLFNFGADCR